MSISRLGMLRGYRVIGILARGPEANMSVTRDVTWFVWIHVVRKFVTGTDLSFLVCL